MSYLEDNPWVQYDPFVNLTRERAISLRWTLRDILAHRTKFLPLADADLQLLVNMRLVVMHDDEPALTSAGQAVIE